MVLFIFVYLFFLQTIYLNLFCLIFFAAWTSLCTHRHWGRWQVEVWAHHHLRNCLGPLLSEYYSQQTPQPFLTGAPRSPLIAFGFDWRNKMRISAPLWILILISNLFMWSLSSLIRTLYFVLGESLLRRKILLSFISILVFLPLIEVTSIKNFLSLILARLSSRLSLHTTCTLWLQWGDTVNRRISLYNRPGWFCANSLNCITFIIPSPHHHPPLGCLSPYLEGPGGDVESGAGRAVGGEAGGKDDVDTGRPRAHTVAGWAPHRAVLSLRPGGEHQLAALSRVNLPADGAAVAAPTAIPTIDKLTVASSELLNTTTHHINFS